MTRRRPDQRAEQTKMPAKPCPARCEAPEHASAVPPGQPASFEQLGQNGRRVRVHAPISPQAPAARDLTSCDRELIHASSCDDYPAGAATRADCSGVSRTPASAIGGAIACEQGQAGVQLQECETHG